MARINEYVKINYRGLLTYMRKLDRLNATLTKDLPVAGAVRGIAQEWRRNFSSEGYRAGPGWKTLSKTTRRIRSQRGYPSERPILFQSGGLKRAATDYPASFKAKSMSRSVPGDNKGGSPKPGGTTTIQITTSPNRARLTLSGAKVANNKGGKYGGHSNRLPARPFWYVRTDVELSGSNELAKELMPYFKEFQ